VTTTKIRYFSAYCGAGKTSGLTEYANRLARQGYKVLLVQPTTRLITETIRTTFPQVGVTASYSTINTETHPNRVKNSIVQYLQEADDNDDGEILLITHSAFFELPYFHARHNWIVIIDEIPPVERSFRFNIPDVHALLTKHLVIEDRSNTAYW
jgi:reverse gyrase